MQLVAASKMKKAQAQALAGKLYAQKIYEMVIRLSSSQTSTIHPYMVKPATLVGKRLVIFISANKGLCGGLNSNLFRFFLKEYTHIDHYDFITIGKKGADFILKLGGKIIADFSTQPFINSVPAVTELFLNEYLSGHYDGVDIVSNEFRSALQQLAKKKILLPLTISMISTETVSQKKEESLIEPNAQEVLEALLPHYIENQLRDALLQAEASEQSARMVAMKNATDNALSLIDELTLLFNKERQSGITSEIADIVTARLAVE